MFINGTMKGIDMPGLIEGPKIMLTGCKTNQTI
jgi:hypothetical protein